MTPCTEGVPVSITAHPDPAPCPGGAAAPAWARLRLCRGRLSRQGCGSRSLSSSDTVTPAPGAHTMCSHSSRSCPQTARGAARAGVRRRAHGWKGLETVVRLGATRAEQAGNTAGVGKGCTMPRHTHPGSSRQGDRPGCDRRVSLQPPCTTRSRSWCHTRGEAHPPRTPSPARI